VDYYLHVSSANPAVVDSYAVESWRKYYIAPVDNNGTLRDALFYDEYYYELQFVNGEWGALPLGDDYFEYSAGNFAGLLGDALLTPTADLARPRTSIPKAAQHIPSGVVPYPYNVQFTETTSLKAALTDAAKRLEDVKEEAEDNAVTDGPALEVPPAVNAEIADDVPHRPAEVAEEPVSPRDVEQKPRMIHGMTHVQYMEKVVIPLMARQQKLKERLARLSGPSFRGPYSHYANLGSSEARWAKQRQKITEELERVEGFLKMHYANMGVNGPVEALGDYSEMKIGQKMLLALGKAVDDGHVTGAAAHKINEMLKPENISAAAAMMGAVMVGVAAAHATPVGWAADGIAVAFTAGAAGQLAANLYETYLEVDGADFENEMDVAAARVGKLIAEDGGDFLLDLVLKGIGKGGGKFVGKLGQRVFAGLNPLGNNGLFQFLGDPKLAGAFEGTFKKLIAFTVKDGKIRGYFANHDRDLTPEEFKAFLKMLTKEEIDELKNEYPELFSGARTPDSDSAKHPGHTQDRFPPDDAYPLTQVGDTTIRPSVASRFGLSSEKLHRALKAIRNEYNLGNAFHGRLYSNGDYVDPDTGRVIGNIKDYT